MFPCDIFYCKYVYFLFVNSSMCIHRMVCTYLYERLRLPLTWLVKNTFKKFGGMAWSGATVARLLREDRHECHYINFTLVPQRKKQKTIRWSRLYMNSSFLFFLTYLVYIRTYEGIKWFLVVIDLIMDLRVYRWPNILFSYNISYFFLIY